MKTLKETILERLKLNKDIKINTNSKINVNLFNFKLLEKKEYRSWPKYTEYIYDTDEDNHKKLLKKLKIFVKNTDNFELLKDDLTKKFNINDIVLDDKVQKSILENAKLSIHCISKYKNNISISLNFGDIIHGPCTMISLLEINIDDPKYNSHNSKNIKIEVSNDDKLNNLSERLDVIEFTNYVLNYLYNEFNKK